MMASITKCVRQHFIAGMWFIPVTLESGFDTTIRKVDIGRRGHVAVVALPVTISPMKHPYM